MLQRLPDAFVDAARGRSLTSGERRIAAAIADQVAVWANGLAGSLGGAPPARR